MAKNVILFNLIEIQNVSFKTINNKVFTETMEYNICLKKCLNRIKKRKKNSYHNAHFTHLSL